MTRVINVYTIDKFNFLPQGSSALQLVKTGGTRVVNGVTCDTYKMDFNIPGDYPIGLYSIAVRMASITLNPYLIERKNSGGSTVEFTDDNIAVAMGGTENGSVLDGETLAGMNFVSTPVSAWNYRPDGNPWNFWFIYNIVNKPTMEDGGETVEDTRDKVYTVYFDDIRQLRAPANQASDVGLFFKIKYFGPAVAVEY